MTRAGNGRATAALRTPDLDGDGNHDNALGGLLAALGNQIDLPFTPAVNAAITGGQALELIEVVSRSAVRIGPGMDLDEDPSDNFSGVEPLAFAFEPEPMPGAFDGYLLEAGPGPLVLRITLFDSVAPIDLPCVAARLRAEVGGREIGDGKLGLGLLEETVNTVLIPHLRNGFAVIVAADCPGGECVPGSGGELLLEFFDEDESGGISLKELRQNTLIESTVRNPDLDLFDADGELDPNTDGIKDTLSFGVAFTAVSAALAAE